MIKKLISLLLLSFTVAQVYADDKQDIEKMLSDFLTHNNQLEQHQKFWAEDLVYTSSSGKRFGKSLIIGGMKDAMKVATESNKGAESEVESNTTKYSAQDVDIRLYGDTAILAFRLVAQYSADKHKPQQEFFNTGTLLKRNESWEVVAWQATKI